MVDQVYPLGEMEKFDLGQIKPWLLRKLGDSNITVELSDDDVRDAVEDALLFYNAQKPIRKTEAWVTPVGVSQHIWITKCVRGVSNITINNPSIRSANPNLESQLLSGSYAYMGIGGAPRMDIEYYEYLRQWVRIANRELSSESDWHLSDDKKSVWIYSPGMNSKVTAELLVDVVDPTLVRPVDMHWFRSYVLALAKQVLGATRSKYSEIPGAGSSIKLDGERLINEGREDQEKLEESLRKTRTDLIPSFG